MARKKILTGNATAGSITITGPGTIATPDPDYYPASVTRSAGARRMTRLDLSESDTADSLTFGAPSAGRIVHGGGKIAWLDLTEVQATTPITFTVTAAKSGLDPIVSTCSVTVTPAAQELGWGQGRHNYRPTDPTTGYFVFEPHSDHWSIYMSGAGLTKAQIEAREGIANASAAWLTSNPASVGIDLPAADGVLKYGEAEGLAVSDDRGQQIWNTVAAASLLGSRSVWTLFERGYTYSTFSPGGDGKRGPSKLHPTVIMAYGTGTDPILTKEIKFNPGFPRNISVQGVKTASAVGFSHAQMSWISIEGWDSSETKGKIQGNTSTAFWVGEGITIRMARQVDVNKERTSGTWTAKSDRESAYFTAGFDGLLMENRIVDVAGFELGYPSSSPYPYTSPQPPSSYSHGDYLSNLAGGVDDPDNPDSGALAGRDVTYRNCIFARGSLTGIQGRPGIIVYDCIFVRNNLGLFFGGGGVAETGIERGNYSLSLGNLFTEAGVKDGVNAMAGGKALNIGCPQAVLFDNIVTHDGGNEDGVTAHGTQAGDEPAIDVDATEGSLAYDNTIVYDWIGAFNDQNLGALNTATLDATTIGDYADTLLSTTGSDYKTLLTHIRTMSAPWTLVPDILTYFRTGFEVPDTGHVTTTATFLPNATAGRSPGNRWDIRLDWDIGDVPADGDTVDLAGFYVHKFDNTDLADFDLSGGTLHLHGGKTSVEGTFSATGGGAVTIDGNGQFWCDGFTDSGLTVTANDGRFLNSGTFTGATDFDFSNQAQAILCYEGSALTVASGKTLRLHGSRIEVGADGLTGTGTLTMAAGSTLRFSTEARVEFTDRYLAINELVTAGPPKVVVTHEFPNFKKGMTITDGTWSAIVDAWEDLPNGLTTPAEPQNVTSVGLTKHGGPLSGAYPQDGTTSVSGIGGYVYLREITGGVPASGDPMNGEGVFLFEDWGSSFEIAEIAAAPTFGLPQVKKVRSGINGTTAPAVTFNVALGDCDIVLDLLGVANGVYDLIVADSLTVGTNAVSGTIGGSQDAALTVVTANTLRLTVGAGTGVITSTVG